MLAGALELFRCSVKSYDAVFQEQNAIHVRNSLKMVGDKNHRSVCKHFEHGAQHFVLGARIEAYRGFIEDDNRRILQKDACQGNAMTLAA